MKNFTMNQKERLILTLVAGDVTQALNTVCKVRGIHFHIDYTKHNPRLLISRPGVEPEMLMQFDTRLKRCYFSAPSNPDLILAVKDFNERLDKLEANFLLVAEKDKNGKSWAKLQIHVGGARRMALTILDIPKGKSISDNQFELPGK